VADVAYVVTVDNACSCIQPYILDLHITTRSATKCPVLCPDILYYHITLNTATCFDPLCIETCSSVERDIVI
jgi:hypothetical protein